MTAHVQPLEDHYSNIAWFGSGLVQKQWMQTRLERTFSCADTQTTYMLVGALCNYKLLDDPRSFPFSFHSASCKPHYPKKQWMQTRLERIFSCADTQTTYMLVGALCNYKLLDDARSFPFSFHSASCKPHYPNYSLPPPFPPHGMGPVYCPHMRWWGCGTVPLPL